MDELGRLYAAAAAGEPARLEPLPVQYPDFAAWQRRHLEGEVLERHLDHWRRRLAGGVPPLDALMDRPRPEAPSNVGGSVATALDEDTTRALERLVRERGATLYMGIAAVWGLLLSIRAGVDEIALGSPVAGRGHRELEPLLGPFLDTVVLRLGLGGDPTFADVLAQARRETLAAAAHQQVPFDRVVTALGAAGSGPLYQSWLNFMSAPLPAPALGGLELSPLPLVLGLSKFELALNARPTERGLHLSLDYSADRLDRATVDELARELVLLAVEVAERPDASVGQLAERLDAVRAERRAERERSAHQALRSGIRSIRRRPVAGSSPAPEKGNDP
jgi:non-ribosomal peptide synthetase component F